MKTIFKLSMIVSILATAAVAHADDSCTSIFDKGTCKMAVQLSQGIRLSDGTVTPAKIETTRTDTKMLSKSFGVFVESKTSETLGAPEKSAGTQANGQTATAREESHVVGVTFAF